MDEREFKDALRGVMVASSPPPGMDAMAALEAARRVRRRRRAAWASAGSALAIVVITAGALLATGRPGAGGRGVDPAGPPGPEPTAGAPQPPVGDTKTVWPTGPDGEPQTDRTASAGPRHEQGVRLESELSAAVPPGLTVQPVGPPPEGLTRPLRHTQSQFTDRVDGKEVWEYYAQLPVARDGKTGVLFALVYTTGNTLPADLCEAAKTLWAAYDENGLIDMGWTCRETSVGAGMVAVVSEHGNAGHHFDQWAFYRHADGTAVYIAQAREIRNPVVEIGLPGLDEQPLTLEQLAALAADPRFRLE
jgi:hypothetical protein